MKIKDINMDDQEREERAMFEDFLDGQNQSIKKHWEKMDELRGGDKINVDKAWDKLYYRLKEDKLIEPGKNNRLLNTTVMKIAASVVVLMALTFTVLYITKDFRSYNNNGNIIAAGPDEKNKEIRLPDGSIVFLNRNSSLGYPDNFKNNTRMVSIEGEAFFDISHDNKKPFIIEAGDARIRVLGTSFSVNTKNDKVEVFVKTGKVLLSNNDGSQSVTLDPGYIGTIIENETGKKINQDMNYLSWNTEILVYDGQDLATIFNDLYRVHNIKVKVDDNSILEGTMNTTFDNQSAETIIRIICTTFNLNYSKDGEIYHLTGNPE